MRPWQPDLVGRIELVEVDSLALRGNPLGDRSERPLLAYLPPSYGHAPEARYPVVYVLQGFALAVGAWMHSPSTFEPIYAESADALFVSGAAPECILAFVDGWTSLGGSQFLDSPAVGRYHSYLVEDVVPFVDDRFRTLPAAAHRALQGHSSGGYGALITAMRRPDVFGSVASHSADGCFELSMLPLVAEAYRSLRDEYGSDYAAWWADFRGRRAFSKGSDFALLECFAMAACYSPSGSGAGVESVDLPFDTATGAIREEVWARWIEQDPVGMIEHSLGALESLRAIWIDAGRSDEHFLDIAAGRISAGLSAAGIEHHYELFPGGHSRNQHRYPLALAYLAARLTPRS